ncbi:premnaspirodiene oxygenase-like [Phoenix dactylifera]|uniref:Premnaspirodiene oxygenase-like n=1 Tax=Phoenix dactylifera TaxID=42345 RepID=A0A8B7D0B2_PHODC|nr:premnaspirodiene oxygenase-like [Phoenix dactylifera]
MELFYCSLFLIFLLLFLKFRSSGGRPHSKLPPGPWELPIIGSIHHLIGSLPHRSFRDLARKHGPLMLVKLGEVPTLVVSSPEAAKEIMKSHDIAFCSRPLTVALKILTYGGKDLIFAPYGDYWRQLRKICILELLSPKRVQSFQSIREEEVMNLIQSISSTNNASPVNLSDQLFTMTNNITTRAVIGNKCKDQSAFLAALTDSIEAAGGFNLADLFPSSSIVSFVSGMTLKVQRCREKVDQILDGIIREHKERTKTESTEEDLLDILLIIQEEGGLELPLTMDAVKAVIFDIIGAGSETSATTLEWAMSELIRHPRVMKHAQSEVRDIFGERAKVTEAKIKELHYLKLVIKEALRLHVPVPLLLPRECRETCEVLGYEIPAKTRVVVNAWAIGRDPQHWGDAEEFKPERFAGTDIDFKGTDFEFIPFGAGRRICPGMSFGLANVELALACLLYYFDWKLPNGMEPNDLDMAESFGATARRRLELYLHGIPHTSCPTP